MTGPKPLLDLLDVVGDACLVVDDDMLITAANAPALSLLGHEITGAALASLCPDSETADALVAAVAGCDGRACAFTTAAKRQDGTPLSLGINAKRSEATGYGFALLVIRELETSLDTCTAHLELQSMLLDEASDGIVAHTIDGVLVHANRAALEQWRMSLDEAKNRGRFGWVHPSMRATTADLIATIARDGEARFESRALQEDGSEHPIEIHARLVQGPLGRMVVSSVRDISARVQTEEMVRYLAYHDNLTGLANRVLLDTVLHTAISDAHRHDDHLGLLFLDLNDFKPVNDTFGHSFGDDVLREVANRISACVRETDTVARLGGDEFVVVLPRLAEPEDVIAIGRKIDETVREPIEMNGRKVCVSGTIGIALLDAPDNTESLLTKADLNMYEARESGVQGWDVIGVDTLA